MGEERAFRREGGLEESTGRKSFIFVYNSSSLFRTHARDLPRIQGEMTLVVHVDSADIMATLLHLKSEFEASSTSTLQMTFAGAAEAHLLAPEIAAAGVSVILSPSRPFPGSWDQRRM